MSGDKFPHIPTLRRLYPQLISRDKLKQIQPLDTNMFYDIKNETLKDRIRRILLGTKKWSSVFNITWTYGKKGNNNT